MYGKKAEPFTLYAIGQDGTPSVFMTL